MKGLSFFMLTKVARESTTLIEGNSPSSLAIKVM